MNEPVSLATPAGVPLEELLRELGPRAVARLGPASERPVTGIEFFEALDALPERPGTLLLAPSAGSGAIGSLAQLARRTAGLGYAGIAVKCAAADAPRLAALAEESGTPLLRVGEHLGWHLFDAMLAQALGEQRHSEDTRGNRGAEALFALADELAGCFGGSVAIEDLGRRIVAYSAVPGQLIDGPRSESILSRRVPDSPVNEDQYRTVLRSDSPVAFARSADEARRVAFAIRAGALPLGTIWAIDASGTGLVTEEQDRRIRAVAALAASVMLEELRTGGAAQQPREERLRTLLDGRDVAGSEFAELGLPEERGAALLAFAAADGAYSLVLSQLRATVHRQLSPRRPEIVTVVRAGRVYALIENEGRDALRRLLAQLLPVLDRLVGHGARVALPGEAHHPVEVAALRGLADRMLLLGGDGGAERVLTVSALRPALLFERVSGVFAEEPVLRSPRLQRLAESDPAVAETLAAWCASFGNVARTARGLGVHENTVRSRLTRAAQHHGIDLRDPDTLLATWLQLRSD
ncbi:PucR family transcriptional regulator [Leucobacter massiliensis]|uniref:PucR family transcriptional regulator n=1 Tax=Leucobacter massiliensis TaxID=1686285 RepID=A0A2S9QNU2_9MICO|nr:helix-turn-helix domain-containing protein [Leucobacter massiliensis]PRI11257.1 PucR family transcriptional regulator [Leucobacter massiliensis]